MRLQETFAISKDCNNAILFNFGLVIDDDQN